MRMAVSPCDGGALVLHDDISLPDPAPERTFQLQKMETVGRLVGGVTHDFANLLTLIAGYSDILLNRIGERDPLRAELNEIRDAANRGARLTGQLLGFTRGQKAEPKAVDLNAIVVDMQRMLRPIIGEYVQLETCLAANLGKVMADPGQMEQVIMNLILNARDAMPTGGAIRIETANGEFAEAGAQARGLEPGAYVMLTISDTGYGIDADSLERVFQPFFTTKGQGTGLGLSTVLSIVKQSGGDVWVRSAPGEGAAFTLCLPLVEPHDESGDVGSPPRTEGEGSETILVVEDEEPVRRLLYHVLERRGYRVLEASNGEEAMERFQECPGEIHLVLTDMVMPGMSGRELGARLREIRPDLTIMYMSGYTDDVLVRTGALGPGMSFLQKPLRPEVLTAKVREALDTASRPFNPR
jgi:nitrogen-specific signal transduction histidine kinase/CheY-like chemotaxis protein